MSEKIQPSEILSSLIYNVTSDNPDPRIGEKREFSVGALLKAAKEGNIVVAAHILKTLERGQISIAQGLALILASVAQDVQRTLGEESKYGQFMEGESDAIGQMPIIRELGRYTIQELERKRGVKIDSANIKSIEQLEEMGFTQIDASIVSGALMLMTEADQMSRMSVSNIVRAQMGTSQSTLREGADLIYSGLNNALSPIEG